MFCVEFQNNKMKIFNLKYVLILSALFVLPTSLIESAVLINEVQIKSTEDRFIELMSYMFNKFYKKYGDRYKGIYFDIPE